LDLTVAKPMSSSVVIGIDETDRRVLAAIQSGLPLVSRPFAEIGARLGLSEAEVMTRLQQLQTRGVIRRFGVVVRHHEVGYGANAMVVWDVPDAQVRELGRCLAEFDFITLCYRRPRHLPQWRFNLYCMIHGKTREDVLSNLEWMVNRCGLQSLPHEVLFSRRRFKQRGAMYFDVQGSTNADAAQDARLASADVQGSTNADAAVAPDILSSATFAHPCASQDARLASAAEPQAAGSAGEG
jgi:DNA-binding Lrp family transcriptional regulator